MTLEHRQVLLLGPPSDIRSLLTSRGKPLAPAFLQTMPYPPSQLAVEDCLCPERHLCCVKLSVSYPLDKITIYVYSLLFFQYTQDFCKDETEFPNIQMPFGVHTVSDREL